MGIFNFFRGKKEKDSAIKRDTIISEFQKFNTSYYLEKSEVVGIQETGEMDLYHLECSLEENFLRAFNTVLFKVGKKDGQFLKTDHNEIKIGSVTFYSKNTFIPTNEMKFVVNQVAELCDAKDEYWMDVDAMRINEGFWRGRSLLCDNKIFIELDEELGFKLDVLGWNEFIDKIAST